MDGVRQEAAARVSPSHLSPELARRVLCHGDQRQDQILAVEAFEGHCLFAAVDRLCRRGLDQPKYPHRDAVREFENAPTNWRRPEVRWAPYPIMTTPRR